MNQLSERIRKILRDTGSTQIKLASDAGVSKGLVTQWLNGAVLSINLDAARGIARIHGYNPGWVLRGEGPEKGPDSTFAGQPRNADSSRLISELEDIEGMGPQWADLAQAITMLVRKLKEARKIARHENLTPEMRGVVETLCKLDKQGGEEREYAISQVSAVLRGPRERESVKKKHAS